jgi:hypothetical protein
MNLIGWNWLLNTNNHRLHIPAAAVALVRLLHLRLLLLLLRLPDILHGLVLPLPGSSSSLLLLPEPQSGHHAVVVVAVSAVENYYNYNYNYNYYNNYYPSDFGNSTVVVGAVVDDMVLGRPCLYLVLGAHTMMRMARNFHDKSGKTAQPRNLLHLLLPALHHRRPHFLNTKIVECSDVW